MRSIYLWFVGLIGTAVTVAIAYQWLDRPIALLMHSNAIATHRNILVDLSQIPDPLIPIAVVILLALGFRALAGRPLLNHHAVIIVCAWSLLFAAATKNQLKIVFGRTWPETWTHNNPSFIHNGVYGFNFMRSGSAYQSFPSGHMTAVCAVISVLWWWYPRWRGLYVAGVLAVGLGLIGANYHFLSDVIAGSFVGISIGMMAITLWNARIQKR